MKLYPIYLTNHIASGIINRRKNTGNIYNTRTILQPSSCDTISFAGTKQNKPKQIIMLLGAPNSGKGTFASKISEKYSIPQISTGDILRNEVKNNTELGQLAKSYMNSGKLVPDSIIMGMFENRIAQADCKNGFILDGFPRTVEQAKKLDELLSQEENINLKIINLNVSEDILYDRSARRFFCEECGKTYSVENYDDTIKCKCGGKLVKRKDDTPEILTDRLKVYHEQTEPLLDYYKDKVTDFEMTEAFTPVEKTFKRLCTVLE